mmetsp:Transcript_33873/g.97596  ORF Transcript_33873/g.97596 Transcript_33873/m.97596 type:complete len:164 (+) Transcript_33873:1576-2067(+)
MSMCLVFVCEGVGPGREPASSPSDQCLCRWKEWSVLFAHMRTKCAWIYVSGRWGGGDTCRWGLKATSQPSISLCMCMLCVCAYACVCMTYPSIHIMCVCMRVYFLHHEVESVRRVDEGEEAKRGALFFPDVCIVSGPLIDLLHTCVLVWTLIRSILTSHIEFT